MKPDLTPAKPWGFHSTGHLNLPLSAGLEGRRVSKELMGKKVCATGRIPVSTSVAPSPPKLTQPPRLRSSTHLTSLHCKSCCQGFQTEMGGKCCTSYFVSNSQKHSLLPLSLVTASRAGKCIVPAFSGGVIRGAEKEKIRSTLQRRTTSVWESSPDTHR